MEVKPIDVPRSSILERHVRSMGVDDKTITRIMHANNVPDFNINKTKRGLYVSAPGIRVPVKGFIKYK